MIERQGIDKLALFKEFELEVGELIELDREQTKGIDEAVFADEDWAGNLCLFFKELARYDPIEGAAFSSEPSGKIHVDYFCRGHAGVEIGNVISRIELARYFVGNPVGSIQWIGRNQAFEDITRKFSSGLTVGRNNRDLLLVIKFV